MHGLCKARTNSFVSLRNPDSLCRRIGFPVKKRLQDQRCGYLVDDAAMILTSMTRFIEQLVRLMGRKAFIPKVNWQPRQFAKFCRKNMHLFRLLADFAGHRQRIADHDPATA